MIAGADISDLWLHGLREWASANGNVRELWLFGSRAKGTARPDSDVDLAIVLMSATGKYDWAAGNFFALHAAWKAELEAIVGHQLSLEAISPGSPEDAAVRSTGMLLWAKQ